MTTELFISLLAIIASLISVAVSIIIYCVGIKRSQKQDTLDAFNLLQEQVFDKLNLFTRNEIEGICKRVEEKNIDDETNEKYYILLGFLARLEHFALGVNTGIYDAATAQRAGTAFLVGLYDYKLFPVIELQKKRGGGKVEYYDEFKNLAEKLKSVEK